MGDFLKKAYDNDMKCPFCQQELHKDSNGYYTCYTDNCGCMKYGGNGASGSESLWLALIRTRKALGMASDCMKIMYDNLPDGNRWKWEIEKTLEQIKITMQEQPNDN